MGIISKIGEMQAKGQKAIDDYNEKEAIRKAEVNAKIAAREDRFDAKVAALPLGLGTLVGPVGAAAKFEKGERKDAKKRAKKLKTGEVQFKFAVDDGQVFDVKRHGKSPLGPLAGARATVETDLDFAGGSPRRGSPPSVSSLLPPRRRPAGGTSTSSSRATASASRGRSPSASWRTRRESSRRPSTR